MKIAIIGGTGVDELITGRNLSIATRFGETDVVQGKIADTNILFLPRHGLDHSVPPSRVNYRAQIAALKKAEVRRVIGVCAVGSLQPTIAPGSFAILGDFIDLTKKREDTFFDDLNAPVVHTDFTRPYCPEVSAALIKACKNAGVDHKPYAVYVGVEGPRYESPAEVRMYGSWGGDVIGMTNLPEAILAREAGLCYGALAVITNLGAGLSPTPLEHDDVRAAVRSLGDKLGAVLPQAIGNLTEHPECSCGNNINLVL